VTLNRAANFSPTHRHTRNINGIPTTMPDAAERRETRRRRAKLRVSKELQVLSKVFTPACDAQLMDGKPEIKMFQVTGGRERCLTAGFAAPQMVNNKMVGESTILLP
jgi:hypothetical protein